MSHSEEMSSPLVRYESSVDESAINLTDPNEPVDPNQVDVNLDPEIDSNARLNQRVKPGSQNDVTIQGEYADGTNTITLKSINIKNKNFLFGENGLVDEEQDKTGKISNESVVLINKLNKVTIDNGIPNKNMMDRFFKRGGKTAKRIEAGGWNNTRRKMKFAKTLRKKNRVKRSKKNVH